VSQQVWRAMSWLKPFVWARSLHALRRSECFDTTSLCRLITQRLLLLACRVGHLSVAYLAWAEAW
jgi:hypothetical protein